MASVLYLGRSEVLDVNVPPYIDPTERGSYDTDELGALEARRSGASTPDRARFVVCQFSGQTLVVDTLILHRVVARYDLENWRRASATAQAEAVAAKLNKAYRDTA